MWRQVLVRSVQIVLVMTAAFVAVEIAADDGARAHSGGTDRYGCHAGSRPYHCHTPKYPTPTTSPPSTTTTSSPAPILGVAGFGDVADGTYYSRPVQWMVNETITTGTSASCFSPHLPVTRGQAAAFVWRMEGRPATPPHGFFDVVADWQQEAVSWMASTGITTGTTRTTFSPDDELTRGQLAALIFRLAGSPPGAPPHSFADVTTDWQQDAVSWMVQEGITTGVELFRFAPDDAVTRAQLAAFLYRYSENPGVDLQISLNTCRP